MTVAPRYTPGSPALVRATIALQVAREEVDAIEVALEGFWGEEQQARAKRLGLRGIVEEKRETGSGKKHGWDVIDLCTGERFFRLTPEALRKAGWRSYDDLTKWEQQLVAETPPPELEDPKKGYYKLAPAGRLPGSGGGWKVEHYQPERIAPAPEGWKPIGSKERRRA
jgi:hypothetical protein